MGVRLGVLLCGGILLAIIVFHQNPARFVLLLCLYDTITGKAPVTDLPGFLSMCTTCETYKISSIINLPDFYARYIYLPGIYVQICLHRILEMVSGVLSVRMQELYFRNTLSFFFGVCS